MDRPVVCFNAVMQQSLVFTDLDGTLLDDRYDLAGAADALDQVHAMGAVAITGAPLRRPIAGLTVGCGAAGLNWAL